MSAALARCINDFLSDVPSAPGVVARVERADAATWSGAAGDASITPRRPMQETSTFRIASNTKTFTAAAVLRLWEQGLLDLDAHLDDFLPPGVIRRLNVSGGVVYGPEITIAQLLQHTAGIREPSSEQYVERLKNEPGRLWTTAEQIEIAIEDGSPYNPPGVAARYSNTGYIVASIIIERISGLPLAQAFRSLLRFNDLKLEAIHLETLEPVPPKAGPRMRQYFGDYDIAQLHASIDLFGGGGLVSDVRDLCGFWRALFEERVFDRPGTLDRMCAVVPGPDPEIDVGLGVFRHQLSGQRVWLHTGFWGTFALHEPEANITIAASVNQASSHVPPGALSELWHRLFEVALQFDVAP